MRTSLRMGFSRLVMTMLAGSIAALAQTAPTVTSVVDSAYFKSGITFGGLATIFGSHFADGGYAAKTVPLPETLGGVEVFLCPAQVELNRCTRQKLIYADFGQINFLVEDYSSNVKLSDASRVAVRVNGIPDTEWNASSPQNSWTFIGAVGPAIFLAGNDCWFDPSKGDASACGLKWDFRPNEIPGIRSPLRAVITDTTYRVIESNNPARIGGSYTIWLTGLGSGHDIANAKSGMVLTVPSYGLTLAMANNGKIYNDFFNGPTRFVGPSLFAGLYQINFDLPESVLGCCWTGAPRWPCGTRKWDVGLSMVYNYLDLAGHPATSASANTALISLPILILDGDRSDCH